MKIEQKSVDPEGTARCEDSSKDVCIIKCANTIRFSCQKEHMKITFYYAFQPIGCKFCSKYGIQEIIRNVD